MARQKRAPQRTRRIDQGDFPEDDPMARVVDAFRELAKLIDSAPDDALVKFAHEGGWDRPHALAVRESWAARHGRSVPERPQSPQMAFGGLGAPVVRPPRVRPLRNDSRPPPPKAEPAPVPEPETPPAALDVKCLHAETIWEASGDIVCTLCGTVLGEPSGVEIKCEHPESVFEDDSFICTTCGEVIPVPEREPLPVPACDHEWEQRGCEESGGVFGIAESEIRVFDHCTKCDAPRPLCEDGKHRTIVEQDPLTYCGQCGDILSVKYPDPVVRSRTTIHHPSLTNVEEYRVDQSGAIVRSYEEVMQDIDEVIDSNKNAPKSEKPDEEILF